MNAQEVRDALATYRELDTNVDSVVVDGTKRTVFFKLKGLVTVAEDKKVEVKK